MPLPESLAPRHFLAHGLLGLQIQAFAALCETQRALLMLKIYTENVEACLGAEDPYCGISCEECLDMYLELVDVSGTAAVVGSTSTQQRYYLKVARKMWDKAFFSYRMAFEKDHVYFRGLEEKKEILDGIEKGKC